MEQAEAVAVGVKMKKYILIIMMTVLVVVLGVYAINNFEENQPTKKILNKDANTKLTLQVNIPCPGHAGLIGYELQKLEGIKSIDFNIPSLFDIYYDSSKVSKENILNTKIFKEYPAQIIN